MEDVIIIDTDKNNILQYPPKCFLNPRNIGYQRKFDWLKKRFSEGLKIKQLYSEKEKKCIGFIEYVIGEYAWRAIDAKDYMFIHCIWISPNKYKDIGYGSLLVQECISEANSEGKNGVAVVTSEGPFMAGKDLFLKNDFVSIASVRPSFELMVKTLKEGPLPKLKDWEKQLSKYDGLNIIYAKQCPWVARSINELSETAKKEGLELKITELKNAKQAQDAPSLYAIFNLVYNGKLLVDHYISNKRFINIINNEIKK